MQILEHHRRLVREKESRNANKVMDLSHNDVKRGKSDVTYMKFDWIVSFAKPVKLHVTFASRV